MNSKLKAFIDRTASILNNITEEDVKTIMNKQKTCLDLSLATLEWALEKAIKVRKPKDFKSCIAFFENSKDWVWSASDYYCYIRKGDFYNGSFLTLNTIKKICVGLYEIPKCWPEELLE